MVSGHIKMSKLTAILINTTYGARYTLTALSSHQKTHEKCSYKNFEVITYLEVGKFGSMWRF